MDEYRADNNSLPSVVVPAARDEDVVITESSGEVLVYDKLRHQIHHLNHTAAVIWRLCDGTRSLQDLKIAVEMELGANIDLQVVAAAISELGDADLLSGPIGSGSRGVRQSRRSVLLRAVGASAIAVPAIVSMTAPSRAQNACPSGKIESCDLAFQNKNFPGCSVSCCCPADITIVGAICTRTHVLPDSCVCASICVTL